MLLHELQELDGDLRRRANNHLLLTTILGVRDGPESIGQYRHFRHLEDEADL